MSKAFTREEDDAPERSAPPRAAPLLPAGAKNYLTPDGARRLREELDRLVAGERPQAAASADPGEARRQLQILDQRIHHLERSLQTAVVVPPPAGSEDQVRFGATVTVRERGGEEARYRIVGIDEADLDRGWVSWLSPMARALLKARVGDRVRLQVPSGDEELEILGIAYE